MKEFFLNNLRIIDFYTKHEIIHLFKEAINIIKKHGLNENSESIPFKKIVDDLIFDLQNIRKGDYRIGDYNLSLPDDLLTISIQTTNKNLYNIVGRLKLTDLLTIFHENLDEDIFGQYIKALENYLSHIITEHLNNIISSQIAEFKSHNNYHIFLNSLLKSPYDYIGHITLFGSEERLSNFLKIINHICEKYRYNEKMNYYMYKEGDKNYTYYLLSNKFLGNIGKEFTKYILDIEQFNRLFKYKDIEINKIDKVFTYKNTKKRPRLAILTPVFENTSVAYIEPVIYFYIRYKLKDMPIFITHNIHIMRKEKPLTEKEADIIITNLSDDNPVNIFIDIKLTEKDLPDEYKMMVYEDLLKTLRSSSHGEFLFIFLILYMKSNSTYNTLGKENIMIMPFNLFIKKIKEFIIHNF